MNAVERPEPANRLAGGLIDRAAPLRFQFDGRPFDGFAGDTLASALLANGVRLMGRSFKYHRPRGPLSAGVEEPNALVTIGRDAHADPNTRATVAELYEGLEARSQNRWPSLRWDAMAVNDRLAAFLGAGFYYKTFMWPAAFWEKVYEPLIRRAAGLGALSGAEDPDGYDKGFAHADLLVIGAGPAGLATALTAGRAGARVVLAEQDFRLGGRLLAERETIDGARALDWVEAARSELESLPNVRALTRTTVFGAYDHGVYGALSRETDHLPTGAAPGAPRQTLWRITAKRAVLAAGAIERPIAFRNNDRPGVMLGGAVRAYLNRWAAAPARRVTVFTASDDGHRTALDLMACGIDVAAVVDARADATARGPYELVAGGVVEDTRGRLGLKAVKVRRSDGAASWIECGALANSGGWSPTVHLTCHHRGRPVWSDALNAFLPAPEAPPGMRVAGAAAGAFSTHAALETGAAAAVAALSEIGIAAAPTPTPEADDAPVRQAAFWHVAGAGRAWLDQQNDVTVKDVAQARQEGYRAVEHLKRYTTLGMATDQGKTANTAAIALMAEAEGKTIAETGTTIFRPPYTPVPIGAFGGRSRGGAFRPVRRTPTHAWAEEQGAVFVEAGQWLRAQWFPRPGEHSWRESVDREALAVRASVGLCDVSTLGKIDVQGADAAEFLNFVYCNGFAKLPVGKVRYGLMLREDGFVMDDGTAARLAEDRFVVTTTTANAVAVSRHLEFVRQCLRPELDVQLISTTEAWAQIAVAGPNARALLQKIVDPAFDISNDAFPYMACGELTICGGLRARLFRISFSGELAYEVAAPARYGEALMRRLMAAGAEFDVTPYGTEALNVLRVEKGHAAGAELNGQVSAAHLGMGRMVSAKKDSIGAVLSRRPALVAEDGWRLVGFEAVDPSESLLAGAHLFSAGAERTAAHDQGWLSSVCYSPHLERSIALGFLRRGQERLGETVRAESPVDGWGAEARVVSPHFIDAEGERLRA